MMRRGFYYVHLRLYPVQLILVMCIVKLTRMTVSNNKLSHVNDCQIFQPYKALHVRLASMLFQQFSKQV